MTCLIVITSPGVNNQLMRLHLHTPVSIYVMTHPEAVTSYPLSVFTGHGQAIIDKVKYWRGFITQPEAVTSYPPSVSVLRHRGQAITGKVKYLHSLSPFPRLWIQHYPYDNDHVLFIIPCETCLSANPSSLKYICYYVNKIRYSWYIFFIWRLLDTVVNSVDTRLIISRNSVQYFTISPLSLKSMFNICATQYASIVIATMAKLNLQCSRLDMTWKIQCNIGAIL